MLIQIYARAGHLLQVRTPSDKQINILLLHFSLCMCGKNELQINISVNPFPSAYIRVPSP